MQRCNSNGPPVLTPMGKSSSGRGSKETEIGAKAAAKQSKNHPSYQHSFKTGDAATKTKTTSEPTRHRGHFIVRKTNQTIWVKKVKTNHPAYELWDLGEPATVNSGKKQCVQSTQIEQELRPRKRRKPNYYASSKSNP